MGTLILLLFAVMTPPHRDVVLAWDASPDATVTGYNVYHGVASRNYTNTLNAGSNLTAQCSNLVGTVRYYFAATAYNASGTESVYSDELVYTVPATPPTPRNVRLK